MYLKILIAFLLQTDTSQIHSTYLQVDKGEFFCPLCRQFSNCVLPLYPSVKNTIEYEFESDFDWSCEIVSSFFEESSESTAVFYFVCFLKFVLVDFKLIFKLTTSLEKVSNTFVVHLVRTTYPQFTQTVDDYEAIWAFLCGVLR